MIEQMRTKYDAIEAQYENYIQGRERVTGENAAKLLQSLDAGINQIWDMESEFLKRTIVHCDEASLGQSATEFHEYIASFQNFHCEYRIIQGRQRLITFYDVNVNLPWVLTKMLRYYDPSKISLKMILLERYNDYIINLKQNIVPQVSDDNLVSESSSDDEEDETPVRGRVWSRSVIGQGINLGLANALKKNKQVSDETWDEPNAKQ